MNQNKSIQQCFRCNKFRQGDRWETGWPLQGKIEIGMHSQIFLHWSGKYGQEFCASDDTFKLWDELKNNPIVTNNGAQKNRIGMGWRYK